jgi:hypothetical protein
MVPRDKGLGFYEDAHVFEYLFVHQSPAQRQGLVHVVPVRFGGELRPFHAHPGPGGKQFGAKTIHSFRQGPKTGCDQAAQGSGINAHGSSKKQRF